LITGARNGVIAAMSAQRSPGEAPSADPRRRPRKDGRSWRAAPFITGEILHIGGGQIAGH